MSSTNRGAERRADDLYITPAWCVRRLSEAYPLDLVRGKRWLEPAVGTGAIVEAVEDVIGRWAEWTAIDIQPRVDALATRGRGLVVTADFLTRGMASEVFDFCITNPPYSLAMEFVQEALRVTRGPVAMLLRMAFLETEDRNAFLLEQPPDVFVLPNRPSFTGKGQDSCAYAWMVWPHRHLRRRRAGAIQVLADTPLAERRSAPRPQLEIGGATP